jgi:SagB-type dehydrogenase family enzyme
MSRPQDVAALLAYHQRSKHRPEGYAPGPGHLDWASQPDPFRSFEGAERLLLPLVADSLDTPFSALRAGALPAPRPLDLEGVAALLELSLGLSAWKSFRGSTWALRCNPSSGNLHPTEGYVACPGLPGLAAGVHHYVSRDHALERRAEPGAGWGAAFPPGGVLVGLSSIHWREAWKYGMRAWRYCQHDAGHAMAALAYAAAALGWRARRLGAWGDADIAALLGLDRAGDFADAEEEAPDLLVWVGPEQAQPEPNGLLAALEGARWRGRANRLSGNRREWPDIPAVQAAALKPRTAPDAAPPPPALPPLARLSAEIAAASLIRQRRSAVDFDGVTEIGAVGFLAMLDALLPRPGVPPWDVPGHAPRVHPALLVHRVAGLAPGLYLLVRDPAALPALKRALRPDWLWEKAGPAHLPLHLLAQADLRDHARFVSCHQDIAADSCFALGFLARFRDVIEMEPWRYRELYWETGVLGQVLYLEAEAAGVRGTGIGCFFDDAMHALLGLEGDAFQSLYHFTVGGPVEDPRLATLAPYAGRSRR